MLGLYHYTEKELNKLLKSITILCDTREHEGKNDHILKWFDEKGIGWKKYKLDYGDYSFFVPADEDLNIPRDLYFDRHIIIERKASLDEFAGNVTEERERIKKEFTLAPENKVLLIENGSYADMIEGKYRSKYSSKSYYGTVHSFWHEFNIPVFFMPDPRYSAQFIIGYFYYWFRQQIK